jgi:hypothetical protein
VAGSLKRNFKWLQFEGDFEIIAGLKDEKISRKALNGKSRFIKQQLPNII